jgi:NUMOD4 motif
MRYEEYFCEIEGFPNYVVSNYGRIVNVKFDRDVNPMTDKRNGMQKIRLYNQGKYMDLLLHRVVAKAFFVNYTDEQEVVLMNGNPMDCSVTNITIGLDTRGNKRRD